MLCDIAAGTGLYFQVLRCAASHLQCYHKGVQKSSRNGLSISLQSRNSVQIERGPGRGLPQAPPEPGGAGKRPQIDDFQSYPSRNKSKNHFDCFGVAAGTGLHFEGAPVRCESPSSAWRRRVVLPSSLSGTTTRSRFFGTSRRSVLITCIARSCILWRVGRLRRHPWVRC